MTPKTVANILSQCRLRQDNFFFAPLNLLPYHLHAHGVIVRAILIIRRKKQCRSNYLHYRMPKDALAPHISAETLEYRLWQKHHQTYVTNLNEFDQKARRLKANALEEIVRASEGGIFNNAAPGDGTTPSTGLLAPNAGGGGADRETG